MECYYRKLYNDLNESTLKAKSKSTHRDNLLTQEYCTVEVARSSRINSNRMIPRREPAFSKELLPTKKELLTLPIMRSLNLKD